MSTCNSNSNELKKKNDDLVEDKPKEMDIDEKINEFGRDQILYVCQFCQNRILTDIEHQTTWIGICISIILFAIFKLYSIPLILILIPLTQQTVHSCPHCLNRVGVRSFYDLLSLTDKVFTIQMWSLGIIVTKKQLLGVFLFFFFAIVFYIFFSSVNLSPNFVTDTWEQFEDLCGREKFIKDNQHTSILCHSRFGYSDISWNGFVIRVDYEDNFFARYRASILIKMTKNENEEPDLYLKLSDQNYNNYRHEILNITRGDYVNFNATIIFEGNSKSTPILEAFGFKKLNEHIFIEPHIHNSGRYSVSPRVIHRDGVVYDEIPGLVSDEESDISQKETDH